MSDAAASGPTGRACAQGLRRRLTAVLAADVAGYSRLMAEDERATLDALKTLRRERFMPAISAAGGRVVKLMGDGALVALPSANAAVEAALAIQRAAAAAPGAPRLRIGVHLGDVILEGADLYGDGVNVAARLEALAPPGGLCISGLVQACLTPVLAAEFSDSGERALKNIARPVPVFTWPSGAAPALGDDPDLPEAGGGGGAVALLAFEDLTGDPALRHLAAGLDEDLAPVLAGLDELRLVAAPAGLGAGVGAARLGRELGAGWLLAGAARASGGRARVTARLIDCAADRTVWARRFDGTLDDVFAFQDAIVEEIAAAVQVAVSDGEQAALWRREAGDPEAYRHFLAGRAAYKDYGRASNLAARERFARAVEIAPRFAAALVGLARTHVEDASFGWTETPAESLEAARALLERAFAVAPEHALAHAETAHRLIVAGELDAALEHAGRAVRAAPGFGDAFHVRASVLLAMGRFDEAVHDVRAALRRTPAAPDFYFVTLADAHLGAGRWREALGVARRVLRRRPRWLTMRGAAVVALAALGESAEARRAAAEIRALSPRFTAERWRRVQLNAARPDMPALAARLVEAGLPA